MVVDDSSTTPQQRPCNNFVIKKQTCLEEKTQILLTNCNRSTGRKTQQTVPKVLPQIFFIQTEKEKEIKEKKKLNEIKQKKEKNPLFFCYTSFFLF